MVHRWVAPWSAPLSTPPVIVRWTLDTNVPPTPSARVARATVIGAGPGDVVVSRVDEPAAFADACRAVGATPWAIVGTPAEVDRLRGTGCQAWLRGYECEGPIPSSTGLVLLRAAVRAGVPFCVDGLGVRAMAASIAAGASAVAVGVHLWSYADLDDTVRTALRGARGRDTLVRGELEDHRVRHLVRGPATIEAPQCVAEFDRWAGRASAEDALTELRERIDALVAAARSSRRSAADPLGSGKPVVQGPMANVSEGPGLLTAVADAGGTPFIALGALDGERARDMLRAASQAARGRPWGAGVIAFDGAPHRDVHLALCAEHRVPHVILAGASAELARRVQASGPRAWLHTPSARLAGMALAEGVSGVVLEGHEAGGHVGAQTSAGLWEESLDALEGQPREERRLVVLAGGLGDAASATFAWAMAAGAPADVDVVLQAGTAFLLTHDVIEHRQLTPTAQRAALSASETLLVGSSANLPLRVVPTPFATEARAEEGRMAASAVPLHERRVALERQNVGRTRIAAKGIERNPHHAIDPSAPRYLPLSVADQRARGAFTFGQGVTVTRGLGTVAELIATLTSRTPRLVHAVHSEVSHAEPVRPRGTPRQDHAPVAIVGMGCVLPGAFDLVTFWDALARGVDAITVVPEARWRVERYWDPKAGPRGPSRSRSRLAGTVEGFPFDPSFFRLPPRLVATTDASQRLMLVAAAEALTDAGLMDAEGRCTLAGERAAVVIGNAMGGEHAKHNAVRVRFREVLDAARRAGVLVAMDERDLEQRVDDALQEALPPLTTNSIAGSLSNVIAGRIAAWLDWNGGAFTVDAACASSLAAITIAVDGLRSGRWDAVLTGGVDTDLSPETFVGFSLAGALSTGGSRPFARGADGFVMGEGGAAFLLARLDVARERHWPIWATIRGVGQASDGRGRGITAPRAEGQRLAIRRAYDDAGVDVQSIGLVEAHGTGTTVGDRTETEVLREVFAAAPGPVWLGSVKSNLGHLKGGSGAAALAKATLALATGVIPPTLHAGPVDPAHALANGPFRLPREAVHFPGTPRRAGVSAFGFGGTDFHLVLEQAPTDARKPARASALVRPTLALDGAWPLQDAAPGSIVRAWGAADRAALAHAVLHAAPQALDDVAARPFRLALAAPLHDEAAIARAHRALVTGRPESGVFLGDGRSTSLVAVLPGQGVDARYALEGPKLLPAGRDLLATIDVILERLGEPTLARCAARSADDLVALHVTMFSAGAAWGAVLRDANVPLRAALGHSLGEYAALYVAGHVTLEAGLVAVIARGRALAACPAGSMVAVALDPEEAVAFAARHGLALAAHNGPRACVLSGADAAVTGALTDALARNIAARRLAVPRAYHSALVAEAAAPLAIAVRGFALDGDLPVYSTTTALPFTDPARELVDALTRTVRFADTAAVAGGPFVEFGPGAALSRHLPGSIALDPRGTGDALAEAAAALLAAGHAGLARAIGTCHAPPARPAPPRPRASTPPRPRVPSAAGSAEHLRVRAAVVAAVSEVSGYPVEAITSGVDLEAGLGIDSIRRLEIVGVLKDTLGFSVDESDQQALAGADLDSLVDLVVYKLAATAPAEPTAPGVWTGVMLRRPIAPAPPTAETITLWKPHATEVAEVVREAARSAPGPDVVAVVPLDAAGRAAAAGIRTVGLERGHPVRVLYADARTPETRLQAEAADLLLRAANLGRELTIDSSFDRELVAGSLSAVALPERPVVLATGGATGIVAACLRALADLQPRIALLGRRPEADVRALGPDALYLPCDVTDLTAVREAVAEVRARFGPIDLVVHGAGVLRDGPADAISDGSIDEVLGPKLDGARALFDATADDAPAAFVAFSSVAALAGNARQLSYSAANAALEGLRHPTTHRSLALGWTAWSDVGMAAPLANVLRARGLEPLTPAAGGGAFRALFATGRSTRREGVEHLVIAAQPLGTPLQWPLARVRADGAFELSLDPAHPALADHHVGGRALVAAAVWVAAFRSALAYAGPGPWRLDALDVRMPMFVERLRDDVFVSCTPAEGRWHLAIHAGATLVCDATAEPAQAPRGLVDASSPTASASPLYRRDLLFHGPAWQLLTCVQSENGSAFATLAPSPLDPVAAGVDAAHQLVSAWGGARTGWLGLPVGARTWWLGPGGAPARLVVQAVANADGVEADIQVTDAGGRLVVHGEGLRLTRAGRWPADYPIPADLFGEGEPA